MGGVAAWFCTCLSRCALASVPLLALAGLLLAPDRPAVAADLSPNQTARILAGMEASPVGLHPASARLVPEYSRLVSTSWSSYTRRIGNPMRDWARRELPGARGATIFYPFSGPDFATVAQLYPDATRYVLVAIQPAGAPPALGAQSPQEFAAYLAQFREGWQRFASLGFFLTRELDEDARRTDIRVGVTAPLMAFAALEGFEVTDVQPIRIAADGAGLEPHPGDRTDRRTWESVRLALARGGGEVVLDYVRLDLSDAALLRQPAGRAWLESAARNPTVLKAASHLPQNGGFRIIRDAILASAPSVLQDETGIEYGLLAKRFTVDLYGRFTKPHHLFGTEAQRSLALAYERAGANVKPLDFRVGYLKESGWSVQLALRDATQIAMHRERPAKGAGAAKAGTAPSLEQQIAALEARVKRQLALAKARPRRAFIGGSTGQEPFADYVTEVRERIARGPELAPGRRSALLSLFISSDGTLQAVELDRTSGSSSFDRTLRAAVHRAAPFPPLPQTVRERADELVVTLQLPER